VTAKSERFDDVRLYWRGLLAHDIGARCNADCGAALGSATSRAMASATWGFGALAAWIVMKCLHGTRDLADRSQDYGTGDRGGDGEDFSVGKPSVAGKSLQLPVAEVMGDLVCQKDFTVVRTCKDPTPTLWFLDVSQDHARRWYSIGGVRKSGKSDGASHRLAA
jgi:hypothetical protein